MPCLAVTTNTAFCKLNLPNSLCPSGNATTPTSLRSSPLLNQEGNFKNKQQLLSPPTKIKRKLTPPNLGGVPEGRGGLGCWHFTQNAFLQVYRQISPLLYIPSDLKQNTQNNE